MGVRPGFKQTDAGVIPDAWMSAFLGDVSERISVGLATSVTQHYRSVGVPIVRNLNIRDGYFDDSDILLCQRRIRRGERYQSFKSI